MLTPDGPVLESSTDRRASACPIIQFLADMSDRDRLVLLGGRPATTRRNGSPLILGIAVLNDRDAIAVTDPDGQTVRQYFVTTETSPEISPYRVEGDASEPVRCGRCHAPIEDGSPAVRCPRCRIWAHESSECPCWTYAETCPACRTQRTAFSDHPSWTPEEL